MAKQVIGEVVSGMLEGFRHAICGIGAVMKLDATRLGTESIIASLNEEFSVLAERRKQQRQRLRARKDNARPKIIQRLVQCCLLNGGVFMASLLLFTYVLLPGLQLALSVVFEGHASSIWTWLEPILSAIFGLLWVVPVFILTRVVNCFWFLDIAEQAYRTFRGRPKPVQSVRRFIVDSVFSYSVQIIFLIQSQLVCLFPIAPLGQIIGLVHLSILYSLYTFEYRWCNEGTEFLGRLTALEENWPYFIGFGMPLALMTSLSESRLIAGCLFAIFFPLFIISATVAVTENRKMTPLHLFSPSLWLTNMIFNKYISCISQQPRRQPKKLE